MPLVSQSTGLAPTGMINDKIIDDHLAVQAIIRSYQVSNMCVIYVDEREKRRGPNF